MVNTCVIASCKTDHKKCQHKVVFIPEKFPVFDFPLKKEELNKKLIIFVNHKDWIPVQQVSKRTTLRWDLEPVPIYSEI